MGKNVHYHYPQENSNQNLSEIPSHTWENDPEQRRPETKNVGEDVEKEPLHTAGGTVEPQETARPCSKY